ncbi:cytochrome P450 [Amycolatopsis cihanbeyliensis]|uniref:Cytochrome P450 n=1 Tax=Amycolatopsis cihanbeyliensis TaxID=1128664 RepID=A0A542DJC6_AMYCI|nr:cytochrome P450 [Amycolatopsis cihanbeyliensis]TQJ03202.1 cytochrome P450 [Amycolatopsis cihanbeyliensis]WCB87237.1 EfrOII [Amycolatopsis cihanbeyliensis]
MTETVPSQDGLPTARRCPLDPPEELGKLRAEEPISRMAFPDGHLGWLVTSHAGVKAVLGGREFGSRADLLRAPIPLAMAAQPTEVSPGMFTAMDPPEHTRYRKLIAGWFTMRRMRQLEPRIEQIVAEHLDAMERVGGPVDLVQAFAEPVSALVISELLGVPARDQDRFLAATKALFGVHSSAEDAIAGWQGIREFLLELVAAKRADPAEDLISQLVTEGDLTDQELITIGSLLLVAGHDTSNNQLALSVHALFRHPEQLAALVADPELVPGAVEELLRYLTIVHIGSIRAALEDTELDGHRLAAGDAVSLSLSAANRDPEVFEDPDTLDITRSASSHVAFGHGVHQCVGQQLARAELRVALTALLRRFPDLRPAGDPDQVRMRTDSIIYGVHELPVTWGNHTESEE